MFAARLVSLRTMSMASSRYAAISNARSRFSTLPLVRKEITKEERAVLRAARRERAAAVLQAQTTATGGAAASSSSSTTSRLTSNKMMASRWIWYAAVGVPTTILVWGFTDENSPPARFSEMIGLTGFIQSYTDEIAKPSYDKLIPDWSQVRPQAGSAILVSDVRTSSHPKTISS